MVATAVNVNKDPRCAAWSELEWFGAKKKEVEAKVVDS
jgi:hypothetical protein